MNLKYDARLLIEFKKDKTIKPLYLKIKANTTEEIINEAKKQSAENNATCKNSNTTLSIFEQNNYSGYISKGAIIDHISKVFCIKAQ